MTREEAIKFLSNTKVYVNGKSKEIQEKLFSLGFQWKFDGKKVRHEEKPFLFFGEDMELSYSSDMEHFTKKAFREITANDILNIIIDEPKYRPFKNGDECFEEMKRHEPLGWIKRISNNEYIYVNRITQFHIGYSQMMYIGFDLAFRKFQFSDGTPFGMKEN